MARRNESILELMAHLPWWVSVCVAVAFFLFLKVGVPIAVAVVDGKNPILQGFAIASSQIAWYVAFVFLLPAVASVFITVFTASRKRRLLNQQKGIGFGQTRSASRKPEAASLRCPRCGSQLILREARKGRNVGSKFWGCKSYPNCTYTQPYKE